MYKLVSDKGRWGVKDRKTDKFIYVFSNVVYISTPSDAKKYTLVDEDSYKEIPLEKPIEEYVEEVIY